MQARRTDEGGRSGLWPAGRWRAASAVLALLLATVALVDLGRPVRLGPTTADAGPTSTPTISSSRPPGSTATGTPAPTRGTAAGAARVGAVCAPVGATAATPTGLLLTCSVRGNGPARWRRP